MQIGHAPGHMLGFQVGFVVFASLDLHQLRSVAAIERSVSSTWQACWIAYQSKSVEEAGQTVLPRKYVLETNIPDFSTQKTGVAQLIY